MGYYKYVINKPINNVKYSMQATSYSTSNQKTTYIIYKPQDQCKYISKRLKCNTHEQKIYLKNLLCQKKLKFTNLSYFCFHLVYN